MKTLHQPVQAKEVVHLLVTEPDGLYVDGTVGNGGHSQIIVEKLSSRGRLICLDRDMEAIRISKERLSHQGERVAFVKASYADMDQVLDDMGIESVHGVFLDLGVSSYQIERSGRGFSFSRDEPLDMRMDLDNDVTAEKLVNALPAHELKKILKEFGEERKAGLISKKIIKEREKKSIQSSLELANLIRSAVSASGKAGSKHPATKSFQALRISVNRELDNLKIFLEKAPALIKRGGRVVILSYHSLEDRIVKQAMINWEKACRCPRDFPKCACGNRPLFKRLHKKGKRPDKNEIEDNPRARSAVLRAAERM